MTRYSKYIFTAVIALLCILCGCIENDIPYARLQCNFTSISAEGEEAPAVIDTINLKVTFNLSEEVDIHSVKIASYTLSEGASVVGDTLNQPFDLSSPKTVTLRRYQDWQWTFEAKQTIERYFTVDGEIGATVIDIPARRVVAYVSDQADMSQIKVLTAKLGPKGAIVTPELEGRMIDFTSPVEVTVEAYGRSEIWTIYVEQTTSPVTTVRVDAWTNVAWVYGAAADSEDNYIEYRLKGASTWTKISHDRLTIEGGSFYARLTGLAPSTTYEARAVSGEYQGATLEFTTGLNIQMPNAGLDNWWLDGKVWNPWSEGDEQYWDTGNKGATTLGASNSIPTDDTYSGKGYAAKLETRFVGIGVVGKLAAGNLFIGKYVKTDGTNGILAFGRPFEQRPTRLRGYFKYQTAPISSTTAGFNELKGRPDTCIIWCALIDTPEPFEIRTNPNNRQLFDPNGSYVVAYGKIESGKNVDNYTQFDFELKYNSTQRVPKYILITASASKYGDYFTGGNGAVLYVDDLELMYDY